MTVATPLTLVPASEPSTRYTPEDVYRLNRELDRSYELIDGQLVEREPMSKLSTSTAVRFGGTLHNHLEANPIASVYSSEQLYACFGLGPDPDRTRKPDLTVVLNDRVTADAQNENVFYIRPDIAIEVISPNDRIKQLRRKLRDYARAGIPLVWIADPDERTIEVYCDGKRVAELTDGDTLTGDPILPGFAVPVSRLFPPPTPAASPPT